MKQAIALASEFWFALDEDDLLEIEVYIWEVGGKQEKYQSGWGSIENGS